MPRCRGGRSIPRADEKSVRSSIVISPSAICRRPATASSKVVLPEPEGPKIAVIRESKEASTSSSKFARGMRQRSCISRLLSRAQQPLRAPDERERQCDGDSQKHIRFGVLAQLDEIINRQRERLSLSRNISSQQNGRAELAESAGKRQQAAGDDPFVCERNRNDEKNSQWRGAERGRDLLKTRIDLGERRPHRADEQRKGHHRHRDQHALPVEDDFDAVLVEPVSEGAPSAEDFQKNQ